MRVCRCHIGGYQHKQVKHEHGRALLGDLDNAHMGTTKKSVSAKGGRIVGKTVASKKPVRAPWVVREATAPYQITAQEAPLAASGLADALFTTRQQRVLGLLFGLPDRSFFANEVVGKFGSGSGAIQRELARLESSGLMTAKWIGNQKNYQANHESPIFVDLWGIVQKTVGVAGPLYSASRYLVFHLPPTRLT